jgi:diguanylate cyclase (GGDEF)-like protein/PAS domain S-box-containing protein
MAECITLDLKQSFDELNECVLITNSDRIIVFVNKAMEKLLHVARKDLLGCTTARFFADSEQFEKMGELYQTPSDQRHRQAYALELVLGDGTTTSAEVVSAPLFDSEHKLNGLLFFARDVSERKALEEQISDIAYTLEDALDAISEGFAIYDSDDRLVLCNDNYREIYAHSAPAMFPGNSFEDILRFGLSKNQYDTGNLNDEAWLAKRLEKHLAAEGEMIEQQLEDGRWLRISETRTKRGGIAGIRADITELKDARAQAELAFKNLSLMADNVSGSISEVDTDGRCVFINKTGCDWFNGTNDELIGTRLRNRFPWKEREIVRRIFERAKEGKKVCEEAVFHFPDGVKRECQFDCNPRFNEDGGVDGLVVMISDITNRKKTERALAELYTITSTRELSHKEKITEILRLGCEHFDLELGIISHIVGDEYTITLAHSPNDELLPGTVFTLGDTYCARTLEADEPLSTVEAANSEFAELPCYEIFALESYIGAPLLVDGIVHGTINFSSPKSRKRPFTAADIQMVRQFADWIGHEIARQHDHQALMDAKNDLERVASIDDLTQILNRRAFLERANAEIHRHRREKTPFTAVMMDIDRFKQINDRHGHAIGDEVLRRFAKSVRGTLRAADIFGRIGGEEFCMILCNTNIDEAMSTCERLRQKISADCHLDQLKRSVSCSMGLATPAREDVEFSTLMQRADAALYQAKATGRDKCVPFSVALDAVGT